MHAKYFFKKQYNTKLNYKYFYKKERIGSALEKQIEEPHHCAMLG